jgi:hypothetical protein
LKSGRGASLTEGTAFARVAHFGNWLRAVADLPEGGKITVLVTISLKG